MRNKTGNIVAYSVAGSSRQPLASADAKDKLAFVKISQAIRDYAANCAVRGVPFDVKIVSEEVTANFNGQITSAEFVELDPVTGDEISEVFADIAHVFNPPAKAKKQESK